MSPCTLTSPSDGVPLVIGSLGQATASLCTRHAWLVRSGCCQQHHGTVHHSGSGVVSMVSFISGPHSGAESPAVHWQDVEIVYTDRRDVAAMCCLLQLFNFVLTSLSQQRSDEASRGCDVLKLKNFCKKFKDCILIQNNELVRLVFEC